MIEFEPPADEVVSFPTWAWCKKFSGHYLSVSRADELAWQAKFRQTTGVAFETWSEFIEGTAIAPTLEDGNAFLNVTLRSFREQLPDVHLEKAISPFLKPDPSILYATPSLSIPIAAK